LAIITLARRGSEQNPVTIRELARSHGMPETFLTQILLKLKNGGLVQSVRGSSGGYRLARPPHKTVTENFVDYSYRITMLLTSCLPNETPIGMR
jgi:Rrf2 family protein